jgi:hypothetical protein
MLIPTSTGGTLLTAIGGANTQTTTLANVDQVPLNADGSLGKWAAGPSLPVALGGLVGEYVSGVVVIAGGTNINTGVTDQSYSAVVEADGTLDAWKTQGSVLEPRMHAGSIARGTTMWILGGFDNQSVWSDIVSATVQADGTVSAWKAAGMLPGPRSHFSVTRLDDYVYVTGGLSMSAYDNPPNLGDAWVGQILADGTIGNWVQQGNLPVPLATHAAFFYGGYLHLCGGINDTSQEDRCWRAPIADHAIGTWAEIASLPLARGHVHQMPVLGANVYSVAGAIDFNLDSTTQIDIGTFQMDPAKGMIVPRTQLQLDAPAHQGPKCHVGN